MSAILLTTIVYCCIALCCLCMLLIEYKYQLTMLQQNSYRPERYRRWYRTSAESTSFVRLVGIIVVLFAATRFCSPNIGMGCMLLLSLWVIVKRLNIRYKKPLVWTPRAQRIYAVMCGISVGLLAAGAIIEGGLVGSAYIIAYGACLLFVLSYCVAIVAVWVLSPVEKHINKGYYDDAARILASMPELKVIGITGSYGKTSTKHYLNRILSEQFNVLMTPGSYNTTLGVIRTVREMMQPYTEIFICEMGAKNIGDIKEICDLVHPYAGIVTAVGEQHLESFKTIENVQRTKFELIDSLPADGVAFVNDDFPYVASRRVDNVECHRYTIGGEAEYRATEIRYSESGTEFDFVYPGGMIHFTTRLLGEFNISNLLPAIGMALWLGMPVEKVRYAVAKVEQVEHRLSMRRVPGGINIIDDAFNSNPDGSRMALDVLRSMTRGKRIVITPGMIELGDKQYEYNEIFGRRIAVSVDVAIIVGEYNRDAILSGLRAAGMPEEHVHAVNTFAEAQRALARIAAPGDTVLYENDLPDTFK